MRAEWSAGLDSDGLRESLWFYDGSGTVCWRLYLLPDSDFMAWDRLSQALPTRVEHDPGSGVCHRLWRRMTDQLRGDSWHAVPLRLHALNVSTRPTVPPVLAASLVRPSSVGMAVARRIARAAGVDDTSFVVGQQPVHFTGNLGNDFPSRGDAPLPSNATSKGLT
ncbi:MAG: hypothetical protein ACREPE_01385 [Lysobacter sp.]